MNYERFPVEDPESSKIADGMIRGFIAAILLAGIVAIVLLAK